LHPTHHSPPPMRLFSLSVSFSLSISLGLCSMLAQFVCLPDKLHYNRSLKSCSCAEVADMVGDVGSLRAAAFATATDYSDFSKGMVRHMVRRWRWWFRMMTKQNKQHTKPCFRLPRSPIPSPAASTTPSTATTRRSLFEGLT
jgi:hypothetical protein